MTESAWIFLIGVWGMILTMTIYCFSKLLTSKRKLGEDE